jgi:lactate dehydrogenase-like 2-hydroxyacid dehydrogenase
MKLAVFSCRPDERPLFEKFAARYGVELVLTEEAPSVRNASLLSGCQAASVITTGVPASLMEIWHTYGIRVVSTRTVGYEHVDYRRAAELGIAVSNVSYTPNTVAEYTVMTILMAIRRMKAIMTRYIGQDYSLSGIRGRELCRMTVGVVGTGRIGERVIQNLSGFGCRILANNPTEKDSVKGLAEYTDLETLWRECDLITFHVPSSESTFHMVCRETLKQMKDGVVLINMARGSVIDTAALIEALESGKVGAAALDVIENESHIYYRDFKYAPVGHHEMAVLNAMPNVLMTPHTAFFTDEAVSDMIEYSITSCLATVEGRENPFRIN